MGTQTKRKPKARKRRALAMVVALPGAERPIDAAKLVIAADAGSPGLRGVILHLVYNTGRVEMRVTGEVTRGDMAWAGSELMYEAHSD